MVRRVGRSIATSKIGFAVTRAGQIANAVPVTFSLVPAGPGSASGCTATGGAVSGGTLVASCDIPNVPVEIYDVTIGVGGDYYAGAGHSVVAVYDSHAAAEAAVRELAKSGFDMKKLSIIGKDYSTEEGSSGFTTPAIA